MVGSSHLRPAWRIAIVCRDRSPGWWAERVAAAAIAKLTRAGCLVRTVSVATSRRRGQYFLQWLRTQDVDGALLTSLDWLGRPGQPIQFRNFPLVLAAAPHPKLVAHSVTDDSSAVSRLSLDHLQSVGYRSCGYLITSNTERATRRFESFREEAQQRRLWEARCLIDLRPKMKGHPSWTVDLGPLPGLKRAIRLANKPVAFCSHNDFAAAALLDWLLRNRHQVPADVGIVGCDDDPMYALANIGLTTVHLPVDEVGATCAEVLLRTLQHPKQAAVEQRVLRPTLVVRASTVGASGTGSWLLGVIEEIQANLTAKQLASRLTTRTGWAYETVARRFKKAMGCTLLQYRNQLRLDRAAELLRLEPNAKIAYVGRLVGFTSPGLFAAAFRARHGVSPHQFQLAASR